MARVFRDVLATTDVPDGLWFEVDQLAASEIRGAQEYGGVRVRCIARLGDASIRTQIDVGFGDAVTPRPVRATLQSLLDLPGATLDVYPPETVIAEKLEAIVRLGEANSRMKDYNDLWLLLRRDEVAAESVARAIGATFARRGTEIPAQLPAGLEPAFGNDRSKSAQWVAFARKLDRSAEPVRFESVVAELAALVIPLMAQARRVE